MTTNQLFTSPKGKANYPNLSQPGTNMQGEPVYNVQLELDPGEEGVQEFLDMLDKETKEVYPNGVLPFKQQTTKEGEQTGKMEVRFASAFKPKMFDIFGEEIPEDVTVGYGSEIVVAYKKNFYNIKGIKKGMNLYLQAVTVVNLVEQKERTAGDYGLPVKEKKKKSPKDIMGEENNEKGAADKDEEEVDDDEVYF